MKTCSVIILLFLTWYVSLGQGSTLNKVWVTTSSKDLGLLEGRVQEIVQATGKFKKQGESELLRAIFNKTQKNLLRHYTQYAGIEELLNGSYDCLTATSLYADILQRTGFHFRIMETNYHIFLVVHTQEGQVLIETTDRFNGFVREPNKINERINSYRKNLLAANTSKAMYSYDFDLYREVSTDQLVGLLYFNQAVQAYNNKDWMECAKKLMSSKEHYNSPRVGKLAAILLQTISVADLPDSERQSIKNGLREFVTYLGFPVASR